MSPFLRIAINLAYEVGKIPLRYTKRHNKIIVWEKEPGILLCNAGLECEEEIINRLSLSYPEHSITTVNKQIRRDNAEYQWTINALEGIENFACGIPNFIISMNLKYKDDIQLGLIYDPSRDELFSAEKNAGATLNQTRIRVTENKNISDTIIAVHLKDGNYKEHHAKYFDTLIKKGVHIRQTGVPSLDLCYVACARYGGFWQLAQYYCDDTALLIANEAGSIIHQCKTYNDTLIGNAYLIDKLNKLRLG